MPVSTSKPGVTCAAMERNWCRLRVPASTRRAAARTPGASSSSPRCAEQDGATVSASTSSVGPLSLRACARWVAHVVRPGAPGGPHTTTVVLVGDDAAAAPSSGPSVARLVSACSAADASSCSAGPVCARVSKACTSSPEPTTWVRRRDHASHWRASRADVAETTPSTDAPRTVSSATTLPFMPGKSGLIAATVTAPDSAALSSSVTSAQRRTRVASSTEASSSANRASRRAEIAVATVHTVIVVTSGPPSRAAPA